MDLISSKVTGSAPGSTMQTPLGTPLSTPHHHHVRSGGNVRERTLQAVEFYNNNVLRARMGAGLAGPRNSVNERHLYSGGRNGPNRLFIPNTENLYRSNSSLELLHDGSPNGHPDGGSSGGLFGLERPGLRREYGSHGSIDVISSERTPTQGESFFAMLQGYRSAVLDVIGTDQRSPGPSEYLKSKVPVGASTMPQNQPPLGGGVKMDDVLTNHHHHHHHHAGDLASDDQMDRGGSPKLRMKLHRLWTPGKNQQQNQKEEMAIQTVSYQQHSSSASSTSTTIQSTTSSNSSTTSTATNVVTASSADVEERQRRRAFAHYDCQSLTANLGYAAKLRGLLLARRRNTTTGASAASMQTRSSTPDGAESGDEDYGDGQTNELLESCPFFRNEVGGEEEREVSLTRMQPQLAAGQQRRAIHRPALACGVALLECPPNESMWKPATCPFQKGPRLIESVDSGAEYYRKYFLGQEHQNWFGMDEQLGPVAISIKREKLPGGGAGAGGIAGGLVTGSGATAAAAVLALGGGGVGLSGGPGDRSSIPLDTNTATHQFRMIVRTSELLTLRGSVIEDSVPRTSKTPTTKDLLEYVAPEVQLSCLRLGEATPQCEQQLLKLDEQGLTNKYKVGILYCRAGQQSEEDMYNNEEAGPAFTEFLETIGQTVRLQGFQHYKAGLDNKTDSTGTHSVYATYQGCEVMFHVSTMLPFTPNNRQQLLRKRHIGNDIVTIVFQEPGALPFTPRNIRSQFQHVFVIVRAVQLPCNENPNSVATHYRVAVSRSKEVPVFGPPVRINGVYPKGKAFADFLLAKVINAENAAHRSEKFATMATRTRQEYLKDLCTNYCSTTLVETTAKFSLFPSKKKEKVRPRFCGDRTQRAAFCWQVILHDAGMSALIECFLGISTDSLVLMEECSRQIVFVTPTRSILGWATSGNSLRVYHHQGECITINRRDSPTVVERGGVDEQLEIIERLRAVTPGCGALEFSLRRNPMGQLGFHVQPDGVVTQVEKNGEAYTAGLRQGCRLVEICKVAVATLSHDQMVDLLKTSVQVTVTVIEPFADGSPRRGCLLANCKFNAVNYEEDYEARGSATGGCGGAGSDNGSDTKSPSKRGSGCPAQLQQPSAVNCKKRYERNFSPPRSSNSSGYGTGSSSRSFSVPNENQRYIPSVTGGGGVDMGTLTSSSSGHSSNEERWYDIAEVPERELSEMPVQRVKQQQQHQQQPQMTQSMMYQSRQKLTQQSSLPLQSGRPLSVHEIHLGGGGSAGRIIPDRGDMTVRSQHSDGNVTDTSSVHDPIYGGGSIKSHHTTDDEGGARAGIGPSGEGHSMDGPFIRPAIPKMSSGYAKKSVSSSNTSTASSSRNNSPRPMATEAKLRAGAGGAVRTNQQGTQHHRNSVNYSSSGSTLQEDLLRLINPDYLQASSDDNFHQGPMSSKVQKSAAAVNGNSHSLGNISSASSNSGLRTMSAMPNGTSNGNGNLSGDDLLLLKTKSRSREGINLSSSQHIALDQFKGAPTAPVTGRIHERSRGSDEEKRNGSGKKEDVILTTARPATIISGGQGGVAGEAQKNGHSVLHITEGASPRGRSVNGASVGGSSSNGTPRKKSGEPYLPLLPDNKEMDWSSLVDTATKAMMQVQVNSEGMKKSASAHEFYEELNGHLNAVNNSLNNVRQREQSVAQMMSSMSNPGSSTNSATASPTATLTHSASNGQVQNGGGNSGGPGGSSSMPELVHQLEDKVLREQRRRKSLENAVRRLTEENRRLQNESQQAAQQLRAFTDWFYQTIDRQQ